MKSNPSRVRRWLAALRLALAIAPLAIAPLPAAAAEEAGAARIVSLGGAVTEILYRLGLGDRIAALDTTSVYPVEALATKPNVGYLRQLSAEGVLSVRPTLVIAVEGAGPPDTLRLVREAGIPVTFVPDEPTREGVRHKIEAVARLVGREPDGAALIREVEAGFAALDGARPVPGAPIRALFILSLQNGRAMVGGRNTTADGILALAGAENVASLIEGFKPMTDEAILAAQPDAVVMMSFGPGGPPPADVLKSPALSQTPAGRNGRLITMNGQYLLGFGPRTPEAARELMAALRAGPKRE